MSPPQAHQILFFFHIHSFILKIKILFEKEKKLFTRQGRYILFTFYHLKEIGRFSSKDKKITKYAIFHKVTNLQMQKDELHLRQSTFFH